MVKGVKMLNPNSRILDDVIVARKKAGSSQLVDATNVQTVSTSATQTKFLKRNIIGKCTLNLDGLPKLRNVLLVKGLKANMISISQVCDQGFIVNFSRDDCNVVDQNGTIVRIRSGHGNEFENIVYDDFCKSLGIEKILKNLMPKVMLGIFLGYSINSKAYRVYNMITQTVMESSNVVIDDLKDFSEYSSEEEIDRLIDENTQRESSDVTGSDSVPTKEPSARVKKNHPTDLILGNIEDRLFTRRRNKAMLVAQGYAQVEVVDFDETFALVVRLEYIKLLLVVACIVGFKLYQMDVKSAFLNGILNEEAFFEQPKGFIDPHFLDRVFQLKKALCGLKQAPRAWRGGVDKTFFIKNADSDIVIAQIYVDDIVFCSTSNTQVQEFVKK
ncbi:uncharacterized protein LOC133814302 [Humulus lupulus]|uniref:uncharacterized protein LOC133814302 n=1 Tax=Humulus lupulus TaxID=3486 RepID=UPI002B40C748|nr:uncharacterized protein LOC133814302 [Humulus lupulus]